MPSVINPTVIVLWEHELIAAARTLEKFRSGHKPTDDDVTNALKACFAAIYSPELASGDCPVTVMAIRKTVMITKTEINAKAP
jgi:hypothetical protein